MKQLVLVFLTLLAADVSNAQTPKSKIEYFVSKAWVDKNQRTYKPGDENKCPKLLSVVAELSPEGSSEIVLKLEEDSALLPKTSADRRCESDIVCLTEDSFSSDGKHVVVMTRNNDGVYPYTKNLAGYQDLFTMDLTPPYDSPVCYFSFVK